jgi:hypothetical protein
MAAHTPGPWRFDPELNEIQANGGQVTIARLEYDSASDAGLVGQEIEANGRLLAAAPVLLEACQLALTFLQQHALVGAAIASRELVEQLESALAQLSDA